MEYHTQLLIEGKEDQKKTRSLPSQTNIITQRAQGHTYPSNTLTGHQVFKIFIIVTLLTWNGREHEALMDTLSSLNSWLLHSVWHRVANICREQRGSGCTIAYYLSPPLFDMFITPDCIPADSALKREKKKVFSPTVLLVWPQIHIGFLTGSPLSRL